MAFVASLCFSCFFYALLILALIFDDVFLRALSYIIENHIRNVH